MVPVILQKERLPLEKPHYKKMAKVVNILPRYSRCFSDKDHEIQHKPLPSAPPACCLRDPKAVRPIYSGLGL